MYTCINIVITCYHPYLIICLKLMLKTVIVNTKNAALNFEYPNGMNNKLNFCDQSICYQGVKTWNNIQNHVKSSKNLNSFEACYK